MNWDTFYVEKPFGNIFIEYGSPILFDEKMNLNQCEKELINGMNKTENSNLQYANQQDI